MKGQSSMNFKAYFWELMICLVVAVIWVPDPRLKAQFTDEGSFGADEVLVTLEEFRPKEWGLPPYDDEAASQYK